MLRVFFNFSWTQFTFSYSYRLPWSSGLLISGTNSAGELWRTRSLQPRDRAGQEAIQPSPRSSSFEAGSWTAPAGYSAGSPRGTSSLWGFGFGGFGVFSFFQLKMPERSRTLAVPTSSARPQHLLKVAEQRDTETPFWCSVRAARSSAGDGGLQAGGGGRGHCRGWGAAPAAPLHLLLWWLRFPTKHLLICKLPLKWHYATEVGVSWTQGDLG